MTFDYLCTVCAASILVFQILEKFLLWLEFYYWIFPDVFLLTRHSTGLHYIYSGPVQRIRYNDSLPAGRSGDHIPVKARFSTPVPRGPTQSPIQWVPGLSRGKSGQGMALTIHCHLVPRLRKSRAIPLLHLWAFVCVCVCVCVCIYIYIYIYMYVYKIILWEIKGLKGM